MLRLSTPAISRRSTPRQSKPSLSHFGRWAGSACGRTPHQGYRSKMCVPREKTHKCGAVAPRIISRPRPHASILPKRRILAVGKRQKKKPLFLSTESSHRCAEPLHRIVVGGPIVTSVYANGGKVTSVLSFWPLCHRRFPGSVAPTRLGKF